MKIAQILLGLAAVAAIQVEGTEEAMAPVEDIPDELVEVADEEELVEYTEDDDTEFVDLMEDEDRKWCHHWSKKKIERVIKHAFKKYDKNHDNLLSLREVCGRRPHKSCKRIFRSIDGNHTGYIARWEARAWLRKRRC